LARSGWRAAALSFVLAAALAALAVQREWLVVAPEWLPWTRLDVEAPPTPVARFKLAGMPSDREECEPVLAAADIRYVWQPDRETGAACGLFDTVMIERTAASAVGEPFSLTCRAAVSLALWELHVVRPAAIEHLDSEVAEIEHFGSYACRNVYGRPNATRSRHATAEALDIAGFVLADGRRVRVLGDWDDGTSEGEFLRAVRDGACRFFDGVLSPDYNEAHRDHFHLDRGPYGVCR
jgi:hypothetical protein